LNEEKEEDDDDYDCGGNGNAYPMLLTSEWRIKNGSLFMSHHALNVRILYTYLEQKIILEAFIERKFVISFSMQYTVLRNETYTQNIS
jgi:hypothetical protein